MKFTPWWPGFNTHNTKKTLSFFLGLLSFCFAAKSQNLPDLRHVCAQGIGNDITLTWSPVSDPCNGFKVLYIFGRIDNLQPFKLIDSIKTLNQTQYVHAGAKATSTTWSYYLVYKFLCNGDTSFSKTLEIDFNQPNTSTIDSVSVDINTGKVIVGWSKNPAPDLMAYVVWTNNAANNTPVDTVTTSTFTHPTSTPNSGVQSYALTAVDSCWNQSVISTPHRTMYLQYTYDACKNEIPLNWSAYVGWNNILNYEINARINNGTFSTVGSNTATVLTYSFKNFIPGDTIELFIRAKDGDKGFTSSSNKVTIFTRGHKHSKRNYLTYATVVDSNSVGLKFLADKTSDTKKFVVYRKKENETFTKLSEIAYDGIADSVNYIDKTAEPTKYSYQYRYVSEDVCGNPLDTSNVGKTIFLNLYIDEVGPHLKWNTYRLWDAGVNEYTLYRGFNFGSGFTWNTLSTFNTDTTHNIPDNSLDTGIAGTCYYIIADENAGNKYGQLGVSKSNTVCLLQDVSVYFPNAFAPGKVNTTFYPVGVNIDYSKTIMRIYARNGQLIKVVTDVRKGWDGTNPDGDLCQDGVYVYICELFGLNGKKYNFKGTLHLLL